MKAILLLTLCIAVTAQNSDYDYLDLAPDEYILHRMRHPRCKSDSDCSANSCCIQHDKKKDGLCRPLGTEGEGCSDFHMCARTDFDKFCPCQESLACEHDPDISYPRNTCQVKNT